MSIKHKLFYKTLRIPVIWYLKLKFSYSYKKAKNLPENYIVLSNHTTDFDPLFVAASFKNQMYFVASEHITRWKKLYAFLKFGFEPIIRYKATVAGSTVIQVLRKTKKGKNVCIFAEGVRSWDGVTAKILPSTGQLVKRAGCGLVTYKIAGGYMTSPVWATGGCRKGDVKGQVVNIYTKEDLAAMTEDEVNAVINRDLYESAEQRQQTEGSLYKGKAMAEGLEKLLYACPSCGIYDCLETKGDKLFCKACGKEYIYQSNGKLSDQSIKALADAQLTLAEKDVTAEIVYSVPSAEIYSVEKRSSQKIGEGSFSISPKTICCGSICIPTEEVGDMAIHGKNALVFCHGNHYYEVLVPSPYSAYKFLIYFDECIKRR
ncbi:MAG: 1-acyl-sn-glycerol-3-phosphate acyltransferase [Clostridia bacterium]|nr:1-acyl-sn-glycerol-3-phosphate acyltransferase [Clostridia bacterium]